MPADVVMVSGTDPCGLLDRLGTVTVHVDCCGQLIGAVCPPKEASISPLELMKSAPEMVSN